jgi:integrase
MGHIIKTPAGTFRANWRDATGRQKAKTFKTRKEAAAFLAETEATLSRGTYVDPHAGRARFNEIAARWLASRQLGRPATERTRYAMDSHVLPHWGDWPLSKIDHMAVQEWVSALAQRLAPASVAKCYSAFRSVLRSAMRSRLIAVDPTDGVTTPSTYRPRAALNVIPRDRFFSDLLPAIPLEYRALVCVAAGAGLRWGEAAGLPWGAVDLNRDRIRVGQVAEETARSVRVRPYPKTRAGVRTVPLPDFLVAALRARLAEWPSEPDPAALVFGTRLATPLRRSNFRRQVWRPALVRAGLLGKVAEVAPDKWHARWTDSDGIEWLGDPTEREAVDQIARKAASGLRFHDLRHSYATWLISDGVPINVVQRVMGHEQASTTLNFYVHASDDYEDDVRDAFGGFC